MRPRPSVADVNADLQDLLLRRAVARSRFENGVIRDVRARFAKAMEQTVHAVRSSTAFDGVRTNLAGFGQPGAVQALGSQRKVQDLMTTVTAFWRAAASDVGRMIRQAVLDHTELELLEVPGLVTTLLQRAIARPVQEAEGDPRPEAAINISFNSVPAGQISQLITSPLGGASGFEQALADLSARLLSRVRQTLTTGLIRGQSVPQVAKALQGPMQNLRWEAERIVRSEFTRTAAQSSLVQYQQNRDIIKSVQWVATLDARTCLQCGMLDGETWDSAAEAQIPVMDTHPNCRCIVVPVIKDAPGLKLPPSTRASFTGQVPETTKYAPWFRRQSATFQREVLGPTRYRLFKSGKLKLGDFVSAAGVRRVRDVLALARRRG